jgi:Kef-type K+ transport system membrane component KefB
MLKTKIGNTVITAAVINDILSLVVLSIILQIIHHGGNVQKKFSDIFSGYPIQKDQ